MKERYNNIHQGKKQIFINNLVGGVAWGIGATIGLAIIIGGLGLLAGYVDLVPVVGDFISEIINYLISKNPNL